MHRFTSSSDPAEQSGSPQNAARCGDLNLDEFFIDGVRIQTMTQAQLIERLVGDAAQGRRRLFTYVNAHCMNVARRDAEYRRALDEFDVVYPDGMSIVWAGRFLGHRVKERLSAADYFERVCEEAARLGVSLYLLGGYPGMAEASARSLQARVPGLRIAGWRHGFFDGGLKEELMAVEAINASGARLLVVGMSVPVQEKWTLRHRGALRPPVVWCVGALFEYFSGCRPRCPRWMARVGLEWLFRLAIEPRRLWRRYLIGNFLFAWRVLCERIRR
ncbi:MAG: hypothetical protein Kow0059_02860 [Candidatus Sumerlaeia bacterium]